MSIKLSHFYAAKYQNMRCCGDSVNACAESCPHRCILMALSTLWSLDSLKFVCVNDMMLKFDKTRETYQVLNHLAIFKFPNNDTDSIEKSGHYRR